MSAYVYNYVFCTADSEKDLQKWEIEGVDTFLGVYDYISEELPDGGVSIRFDTYGSKYRSDFIVPFIEKHRETIWYCVEENEVEEGWFRWEDNEVKLSVRELAQPSECIFYYEKSETQYRMDSILILKNDGTVEYEDVPANRGFKWQFSEESVNRIVTVILKYRKEMEYGTGCVLPDINNPCLEYFGYWFGEYEGEISTMPASETNKNLCYRPDILDEILREINRAFADNKIEFQISSAYLTDHSESDPDPIMAAIYEECEKVNSRPDHAKFSLDVEKQKSWHFREAVINYLAEIKTLWDNGVITNRDSLLPVVSLVLDYEENRLRVDYCRDLEGEDVIVSKYYAIGNAEEVAESILAEMNDGKWRKEKAVLLSFDDGYTVEVQDDKLHRELFQLKKLVAPASLRMIPLRKVLAVNGKFYRKKKR